MTIGIRGRDPATLLRYEASRRPVLQALLDRVELLSDQEIDEADLPLPWMRKEVRRLRDAAVNERRAAQMTSAMSGLIQDGQRDDPIGAICEYRGMDFFMKGRTLVEVRDGTLVFVPSTGGVWIDWSFYPSLDPALARGLVGIDQGTRDRYHEVRRERLLRLHGDAPVINLTGDQGASGSRTSEAVSRLGAFGVTFSR